MRTRVPAGTSLRTASTLRPQQHARKSANTCKQSYISKDLWRQGIGSVCKGFLLFNTMPCRHTPYLRTSETCASKAGQGVSHHTSNQNRLPAQRRLSQGDVFSPKALLPGRFLAYTAVALTMLPCRIRPRFGAGQRERNLQAGSRRDSSVLCGLARAAAAALWGPARAHARRTNSGGPFARTAHTPL